MSATREPQAVAVARAHVEAWSNHDYDTARGGLAPDVHVTAITTMPFPPPTDLTGAGDYMTGLIQFAQAVVPGSARIIASTGDDRNALIMLTVELITWPAPPGTRQRPSRRPPTWPPSSAASSSLPDLRHLILTSRDPKKSASSAWLGRRSGITAKAEIPSGHD